MSIVRTHQVEWIFDKRLSKTEIRILSYMYDRSKYVDTIYNKSNIAEKQVYVSGRYIQEKLEIHHANASKALKNMVSLGFLKDLGNSLWGLLVPSGYDIDAVDAPEMPVFDIPTPLKGSSLEESINIIEIIKACRGNLSLVQEAIYAMTWVEDGMPLTGIHKSVTQIVILLRDGVCPNAFDNLVIGVEKYQAMGGRPATSYTPGKGNRDLTKHRQGKLKTLIKGSTPQATPEPKTTPVPAQNDTTPKITVDDAGKLVTNEAFNTLLKAELKDIPGDTARQDKKMELIRRYISEEDKEKHNRLRGGIAKPNPTFPFDPRGVNPDKRPKVSTPTLVVESDPEPEIEIKSGYTPSGYDDIQADLPKNQQRMKCPWCEKHTACIWDMRGHVDGFCESDDCDWTPEAEEERNNRCGGDDEDGCPGKMVLNMGGGWERKQCDTCERTES